MINRISKSLGLVLAAILFTVNLPKAQTLPTDLTTVPIYDTTKAGLSFKKDKLSVVGMWEVPGKPKHFLVAGYFGYLWTLYPDTTKPDITMPWGPVKDYTRTQVADFNTWVMKGWEFGTLSGAFDPNFKTNRYFYVVYNKYPQVSQYCAGVQSSSSACGGTNVNGPGNATAIVVVDRYIISADYKAAVRDTEIIRLFHGSGYGSTNMIFGNDGMLYITTDAYDASSWDSTITGRKILRIDVSKHDAGRECVAGATPSNTTLPCGLYSIPTDNPWYNVSNPAVRKEVFAFGFRNTYSLSYNYLTNALYGAETGQTRWEEINHILPGRNYGWNNGGDGASAGSNSSGIEGPCHVGNALDSTSAGGGYSSSGTGLTGTNTATFRTPWSRTVTGVTYSGTYDCSKFTNAAWYTAHTAANVDGMNNLNSAMRSNVGNISPVFRGDPASPLYGYMLISDIQGNANGGGGARNMNFWAVKQERISPTWVGSFATDYTFSQVGGQHDGIHTWAEDSYGNLYPLSINSSASGASDWHDIWVVKSASGGMNPLSTPRAQVTPLPGTTTLWDREYINVRHNGLMVNAMSGSLLTLPQGFSKVELYNLIGKRVWSGKTSESRLRLPEGLGNGILQVRFLP